MTFYSHSLKDELGKSYGTKLLSAHTEGVCDKGVQLLRKNLGFTYSIQEIEEILGIVGKLHDLGKYTQFFQNYLLDFGKIDYENKRHPPIGALAGYYFYKDRDEKKAMISFLIIFLHHANLTSLLDLSKSLDSRVENILEVQIPDLNAKFDIIEKELDFSHIRGSLPTSEIKEIRKGLKRWASDHKNIETYFFINYLFSLLIEADKIDASDLSIYNPKKINPFSVDERFGIPGTAINSDFKNVTIAEIRNFCRHEVISQLEREETFDHDIFTLTAPTGIGKTMTALDFALRYKQRLEEKMEENVRIIYALPFVNIIEQSLGEYKKTLPEDTIVLGHYQYADIFGQDRNSNEDEQRNYNQLKMTLDTWQADIVITSFVQFFETLIGNRNKLLKKFSHYANSIIILDEVQALRLDQMPLIGATLFYLTKYLKSKVILMTATKPKILDLAQSEILRYRGEEVKSLELLTSYDKVFRSFTRTQIVPLIEKPIATTEEFIDNDFRERWSKEKSCLIVVNTVSRSIELFHKIKEYLEENDYENPIEYLSTNITPKDRLGRIVKVKSSLENKKAPILIATQVVEAGVDLDFDMGFRDLGPIDSIIQVAGRINRNFNTEKPFSPLYIVDFGDCQKIYKTLSTIQAINALTGKKQIPEPEYLDLIESYFQGVSEKKSFDHFNRVFEAMEKLQYDSNNDEPSVSDFKIIEESTTTQSVYIEADEEAAFLREMYYKMIKKVISTEEYQKKYKLKFQQNILGVPNYLTVDLDPINKFDDNIRLVPFELLDDYYDPKTGFIRKRADYLKMF